MRSLLRYRLSPAASIQYIGWIGHDNLGDEALLTAARALLSTRPLVADEPPQHPSLRRALDRQFAATVVGGGTLLLEPYYLHLLPPPGDGKVFAVLGTGAPLDDPSPAVADSWRTHLERATSIGVRGERTRAALAVLGIESEVIGDLACSLHRPDLAPPLPESPTVAINVTRLQEHSGAEDRWVAVARGLQASGIQVCFLVVSPEDAEDTRRVGDRAGVPHRAIHPVYRSVDDLRRVLADVSVVVATRLHAAALATVVAARPAILVGYRPKCKEWMSSIGAEHHLHSLPTFDAAAVTAEAQALVEDPGAYLVEAQPRIARFADSQRRHANAIITRLDAPR